ncbi:hypothetical protein ABRY23_06195 [Melioribacteraceae bacterium 4301-Me]|uniref:hypothetical protein n=1 Tax=Pyranulibacter aquaticus TaxID=3163344 RepID=UPI0035975AAF
MKVINQSIFFLVFIAIFTDLFSQNKLKLQFDYANKLFAAHQYFDAITEYKRLQFFDTAKQYAYQTNYQIAMCYKLGAHFDNAIKYFFISEQNAITTQQKFNSKIQIIRTNILRRTTEEALQLLDSLDNNVLYDTKKDTINYWRGWAFIFANEWEKAANSFAKIDNQHPLKIICQRVDKEKYSVTFAKVISYILPGAGQIYTGHILSGLMSLSWNLLAGYWTVNSFVSNRIFDGFVVGDLVWLRFYRGNIQNAEKFAVQKNIDIANKTLRYLQTQYEGIKP